jgi:hypothetical protein
MVYNTQELVSFWTFSIVRYSRNQKTKRFGDWICFRPQERGKTPTQLCPLKRTYSEYPTDVECVTIKSTLLINGAVQWLRLALSKGSNSVGVFPLLLEDGNRSSFQKLCFLVLEYRTMEKCKNPIILNILSSFHPISNWGRKQSSFRHAFYVRNTKR